MATSLYDLTVPTYLQTLSALAGVLDKGQAFCSEHNIDPAEIVDTRLFADMLPLRFQILSVAHHSLGAIRGMQAGLFEPPSAVEPLDYAGLQKLIADTRTALQGLTPDQVNALAGKHVDFQFRGQKIPFTAENFALSFSLPNFFFHATTAYDILRNKGVKLGKRDYLGQMRVNS